MSKLYYITGLSGSGKSTLAFELQKYIKQSIVLDGDIIRETINSDLGFTQQDKKENIRRNNALIKLLYDQNLIIICAFMASIKKERDKIFNECPNNIKIQLTTPLEECIKRDIKGLYKNNLDNFAGVSAKYESLENPDLCIDTKKLSIQECINIILEFKK